MRSSRISRSMSTVSGSFSIRGIGEGRFRTRRWALPIQQQHFETVRSTSLELAAEENPNEPAA